MYGYEERIRMKNVECFVAGIVKGVKEHGDTSRHFGSTLALKSHFNEAMEYGLVSGTCRDAKLTEKGEKAYEVWRLVEMPDGRSYLWPRPIFHLEDIVPEIADVPHNGG
jgi:hypothetical protein